MQLLGRGVEAAGVDHCGEGGELVAVDPHISNTNADEESLVGLIPAHFLTSMS